MQNKSVMRVLDTRIHELSVSASVHEAQSIGVAMDNRVILPMFPYRTREMTVNPGRHVKLIKKGRSQIVRIPREFELPGKKAIIRKDGDRLIIEPVRAKSLLAALAKLAPLDEEFPPISDPSPGSTEH